MRPDEQAFVLEPPTRTTSSFVLRCLGWAPARGCWKTLNYECQSGCGKLLLMCSGNMCRNAALSGALGFNAYEV